jgi:hypothetical protein
MCGVHPKGRRIMSTTAPLKLLPRNAAALRRAADSRRTPRLVPGNSVATRPESGVGNCYPGLECDLRNLERRFFPFLEVDLLEGLAEVRVLAVDMAGVDAAEADGTLDAATATGYRTIAGTMPSAPTTTNASWMVTEIEGDFGPLGHATLTLPLRQSSMGPGRTPPDAWVAIRMLTEGSEVRIVVGRGGTAPITLRGRRTAYLDANGALADIFLPGELSQSLCSPWTHDFRDCGCYYWASNHPDIVLPPDPPNNTTDERWNLRVDWQRRTRTPGQPPPAAAASGPAGEFRHNEINLDWQRLNFVVEAREQTAPYRQQPRTPATPFALTELDAQLRYAAGVEIAVMQAYLAAAFSLRDPSSAAGDLADDLAATRYEIMRIAIGEMRHIRAVRDVLAALAPAPPFDPPLRIATRVPGLQPSDPPFVLLPAPLSPAVLDVFIAIEGPNTAVDGLYNRILATLELVDNDRAEQAIRRVMTEGEDHQKIFKAIRSWLAPYAPNQYLRTGNAVGAPGVQPFDDLQTAYLAVLNDLHAGYSQTTLAGASQVNDARDAMNISLAPACDALAAAGFLVTFAPLSDPRFVPIDPPP